MKRLISLILCASLVVLCVCGCSNGANESSAVSSEIIEITSAQNAAAESEAVSSAGAKPVLISAFTEFEGGQPKIVWKNIKGRKGFSVSVTVKDSKGKTVEAKNGIAEDFYTLAAKLTEGEKYSVQLCYVTPSGKKGIFAGANSDSFSYTHCAPKSDYYFNYSMPLSTLNNYLSKAITYCVYAEGDAIGGKFDAVTAADAKRAILNTGAKHIARAICTWRPSEREENGFPQMKAWLNEVHKADPEIIFEACIFETCQIGMNTVAIPDWVFKAFGKNPENRNFDYTLMLHSDGYGKDKWGKDVHIPDITKEETQMWFYYKACTYIDLGIESLHMGQMNLIGNNDIMLLGERPGSGPSWTKVIGMIREYAKKNARRHYVLINGHYPKQNLISSVDGTMLCDFNSFPIGIKVAADEKDHAVSEDNPQRCELYERTVLNIRGVSPGGWFTAEYPYLLEYDNSSGLSGDNTKAKNMWGYDQISWITNQPDAYRRQFIKDTYKTVEGYGAASHVALPGRRTAYVLKKGKQSYYVMNDASYYASGFSDEATIKEIFSK